LKLLRRSARISYDAFSRFLADDGWAIASHIALSTLMAMFPFLLVVTAMAAAIFGSQNLAEEGARILLTAWPKEVAGPIAAEIHNVLTSATGDALTVGLVLALFFASSGVESLRVGLNRSYGVAEQRPWWLLRLESIGYVLIGAVALLAFAILVVFAPLIWAAALRHVPELESIGWIITFGRFAVAVVVLVAALVIVHLWLPAGRRRLSQVWPGIVATLLMWLVGGSLFGRYLAEFAFAYAIYYAGLASVMIVLVFLYLTAAIFIYGGELNFVIARDHEKMVREAPVTR
jgi:membrane protein